MTMINNDSFELATGSSPQFIEDVNRSKRSRTPMIVLGLVLVVFVLGFVVVLGMYLNVEKNGEQASDSGIPRTAKLTGSRPYAHGNAHEYGNNSNNACDPTELQEELAKAKNTIKELQDKIASIPCQLSCDGVTLKEIEIPARDGPPIRRNVSMDGNWTVIQRRQDGCLSFTKTWAKYRAGFGSPCGNYWLGLEAIHQLTKFGDHELRIDMIENNTGTHYWAEYSSFRLESEAVQYTLRVSGYSGNATDPLTQATTHSWGIANNQKFSTYDVDNDEVGWTSCAAEHLSGWWYRECSITNLNGQYGAQYHDGIFWLDDDNERRLHMRFSEMKIRKRATQQTSVPSSSCPPVSCEGVSLKEIEIPSVEGPPTKRNVSMDGNWTVIQRRIDGCVSFTKAWVEYRAGFGSQCGNFWLGLEAIYQLTKFGDHELRIDMIEEKTGTHYWAEYSSFRLEDESLQYALRVSGYSGNATDPFSQATTHHWGVANNQWFSTYDVDNDVFMSKHCAAKHLSGWWYQGCSTTNLNGQYGAKYHDGILWLNDDSGRLMNMVFSEMKIRKRATQETSVPSSSCPPVSCEGVSLKEIEIPSEEGSSTKRNVSLDGNWIVIQRRIDGCLSFRKTWVEYRAGFGSPCGNFWLGLEAIYQLTKNRDHELRIDLIENGTRNRYWAEYSSFRLEDESLNYALKVSGYSGNATDPLTQATKHHWGIANNQRFGTYDVDNVGSVYCTARHSGGWWYRGCSITNLNGQYGAEDRDGILWLNDDSGKWMNMEFSEMKIRKRKE